MPDFTVMVLMERIPGAVVRKVPIAGIEQKCLCIPWDNSIFTLTKKGEHGLQITLREKDQMLGGETHTVYFSYPDRAMVARENKSAPWCGRCYLSKPIDMNQDNTNNSTFASKGVICLDDIPQEAVFVQPSTGRRFVRIMCTPLAELDRGRNTTRICIDPDFGAESGRRQSLHNGADAPLVEVGRMRELTSDEGRRLDGLSAADSHQFDPSTDSSTPADDRTLDGYRF